MKNVISTPAGRPAFLHGPSVNQPQHGREPGLPSIPATIAEREAATDRYGQARIWQFIRFGSNAMAPSFPAGTLVAVDMVTNPEQLKTGRVYVLWEKDQQGNEGWHFARLRSIDNFSLIMTQDNSNKLQQWPLAWTESECWRLYEVTHYGA